MPRRLRLTLPMLLALALVAALLTACGGSGGDTAETTPPPPRTASAQDFPDGGGKTVTDLTSGLAQGPAMALSGSLFTPGVDRVGFALIDRANKQVSGYSVAVYVGSAKGTGMRGPYLARSESLAVQPQFLSTTAKDDPDAAHSVYVASIPFGRARKQALVAIAKLGDELVAVTPVPVQVGAPKDGPPAVGDAAIRIHTPTVADVGGKLAQIDTRIPPRKSLHEVDFADVLGKRPAVLVFATPLLCQSRVCGPVVDIAAQLQAKYGSKVAFIHQEIWKNNKIADGPRQQVLAWRLQTEPWTFVIDRAGKISSRFEGAVSVAELDRAIAKVAGP